MCAGVAWRGVAERHVTGRGAPRAEALRALGQNCGFRHEESSIRTSISHYGRTYTPDSNMAADHIVWVCFIAQTLMSGAATFLAVYGTGCAARSIVYMRSARTSHHHRLLRRPPRHAPPRAQTG